MLHKKRTKVTSSAAGALDLLQACQKIVHGHVDLTSWKQKIEKDAVGSETAAAAEVRSVKLFHHL